MMVGYKEWSLVCEALGSGEQTLLLRKGGIAEGKAGFAFKHRHFYLFPTLFHQQAGQVQWPPRNEEVRDKDGSWLVRYRAEITDTAVLTDWEKVKALQPFHIWKEDIIRERFVYQGYNHIHAAVVRIYKLRDELVCPETREMGGCRSWIEYPDKTGLLPESFPVLTDESFSSQQQQVQAILGVRGNDAGGWQQ